MRCSHLSQGQAANALARLRKCTVSPEPFRWPTRDANMEGSHIPYLVSIAAHARFQEGHNIYAIIPLTPWDGMFECTFIDIKHVYKCTFTEFPIRGMTDTLVNGTL